MEPSELIETMGVAGIWLTFSTVIGQILSEKYLYEESKG